LQSLLARTTAIAALLTLLTVVALNLFVTWSANLQQPPEDFASWPAPKKEAYLYEHRPSTYRGVALLELWLHEPSAALPVVVPQIAITFPLAWFAAFFGGLWQIRSGRHNYSFKATVTGRGENPAPGAAP
jgi:hypothetical protein